MNQISKILLAVFIMALSCNGAETPETIFSIPVKEVIFSFEAGERKIAVNANKEFTARSSELWCRVSPPLKDQTFTVTVNANETVGKERTAVITVTCGEMSDKITVRQRAIEPSVSVQETIILINETENPGAVLDFTLDITANIPVVFDLPGWIREKEGNAPVIGWKTYTFQAVALTEDVDSRTGNMAVKSADASIDISVTIRVTQNAYTAVFTIPVFPDTQTQMLKNPDIFYAQVNWIVAKADSLRAPIVLHVGDVVEYDKQTEWTRATNGMSILDRANIPYAITVGNHDTAWSSDYNDPDRTGRLRDTRLFNQYFPVSRFKLQKGRFEANKSDNAYYIFEAGGLKWIVVTLEFWARESAAQWMDETLKKFPDHNAIILTHYHLGSNGTIAPSNDIGDMNCVDIFNRYIKPNPNVLLVLSGHVCYSAQRTDIGSGNNPIYQILQDYQCDNYDYIRLLEVDRQKRTISAKMFSPITGQTLNDQSKFIISAVNFIK